MDTGFKYPELKDLAAGRKVAMAVSGGADSLLSTVLLKESGADIVAVHGCFLGKKRPKSLLPDWRRDVQSLMCRCMFLISLRSLTVWWSSLLFRNILGETPQSMRSLQP